MHSTAAPFTAIAPSAAIVTRGKKLNQSKSLMGDPITRFSEVRALIFDLDGTLIDSKLDLALSVNATLAELGRNPLPHEQIFSYVGQGAPALIARALGSDASEQDCLLGLEFFIKYYSAHKLDNTVLYPGVRETLDALNGMPMAVYTNKPVRVSRSIIQDLGVAGHFRLVYGGNSFERKKPDPMGVESILREFGAAPAAGDDCRRFRSRCPNRAQCRHLGLRRHVRIWQPPPRGVPSRPARR